MESETLPFHKAVRRDVAWHIQHIPSKRIFDVLFSLSVLIIFAPLFAGIAIAIRLSSEGKIIYIQSRLGQGGKIFKCYKFRTMYPDAQRKLPKLLQQNPQLRQQWSIHQKLHDDPRIFPLGKWLRRTSLDELPQFWNVLKGDLSVVGPRPYMIYQKRQMGFLASTILSIRPGITGLWQTSGRSKTTFAERMALDVAYIGSRGLWLDVKLIIKTIPQLFCFNDAC